MCYVGVMGNIFDGIQRPLKVRFFILFCMPHLKHVLNDPQDAHRRLVL